MRGRRHGITHLTAALNALPGLPRFDGMEAIIIAADNDDNPGRSFGNVQQLISNTAEISPGRRYAVPSAPLQKAEAGPAVVVMMIPWADVPGALDTLCIGSASAKRPAIGQATDVFASACGVDDAHGWSITKQGKMKLRSLIAAAHKDDPYLPPAYVWGDNTDLVPLDHGAFDQIADFLRDFENLVGSP